MHTFKVYCAVTLKNVYIHPVITIPIKIKNISNTQKIPLYSFVVNLPIP